MKMNWLAPIGLRIFFGWIVTVVLLKKMTGLPSRTRNFVIQFALTAVFTVVLILAIWRMPNWAGIWPIAIIGFLNAFAAYAYWRAIDISVSKTGVFTQLDDLIAMGLGYFILHEQSALNPMMCVGVLLSLLSVFMFSLERYKQTKREALEKREVKNSGRWTGQLPIWIMVYSIIWGVAFFSFRYFPEVKGVTMPDYLLAWYLPSFIGALIVYRLAGKGEAGHALSHRQMLRVFPLAIVVWICLVLSFWSYSAAPVIVVQPIFQVAEIIFPTIIGLFVFREAKHLTGISKLAMILGFGGSLFVVFGK